MRARIGAGVAGWLAGLAPLVAVNVASYFGVLSYDESVLAGALGLFGGIALGGVLSGALGARRGGGMSGAATGGGIAAALYATTIIVLVFITGSAPPLIAEHPIRARVAILFCGALLLAVALAAGTIVGRGSARAAGQAHGQRAPVAPRLGVPTRALYGQYGQPQPPARVPSTPVASRQRPWGYEDASGPKGAEDASVYAPGRRGGAEGMSRPVAPRQGPTDGQGRYDERRG